MKQHRDSCKQRQKDAASILGIGHFTYMTWEKDQKIPFPRYYPAIIEWLGYDPFPKAQSQGEKARFERLRLGLTSREMAELLEIDQSTLLAREKL